MDAEQFKKFEIIKEFLKLYNNKILDKINRGRKTLVIDYNELSKFSIELAVQMIEQPEDTLKLFEVVLQDQFDDYFKDTKIKKLNIRIKNLVESQKFNIKNINGSLFNKFIKVEGIVKTKSMVRPKIIFTSYECSSCNNIIKFHQFDNIIREPNMCSCGKRGKFILSSKEIIDGFSIILKEIPEFIKGGKGDEIVIFFKDDLIEDKIKDNIYQGTKVIISGVLKEIIKTKGRSKLTDLDWYIDCNYVDIIGIEFNQLTITNEDIKNFKVWVKEPDFIPLIIEHMFSRIKGGYNIKFAVLLYLLGGVTDYVDGIKNRGFIHILLIGDPSTSKSDILKITKKYSHKCQYIEGPTTSGVGLTYCIIKDELTGDWAVEGGVLSLCHKGHALIDEFEKTKNEDRDMIHGQMENGVIPVHKANIHVDLMADTGILAAANPMYSKFEPYTDIFKQINLKYSLISRFDLIFVIKDIPEFEKDKTIAKLISNRRLRQENTPKKTKFSDEDIRKFLFYARQREPHLTEDITDYISDKYAQFRNNPEEKIEGITSRQVEGIFRLLEALCKLKLKNQPSQKDVDEILNLLVYSWKSISTDENSGNIDMNKITFGVSHFKKKKFDNVFEIIKNLSEHFKNEIPIKEVIIKCEEQGITEQEFDEVMVLLKRRGDIIEPRPNKIQVVH